LRMEPSWLLVCRMILIFLHRRWKDSRGTGTSVERLDSGTRWISESA
jgi:hypothetical protein